VHRLLGEKGEYGGADIAATGSSPGLATEAAAASWATPASIEFAAAVAVSAMLGPPVVLVDPGRARIVSVVSQSFLLSYPNARMHSRYIGNISQPYEYSPASVRVR
jgi:hypothetical protein